MSSGEANLLEYTNHSRLAFVEDEIVYLEIAMNQCCTIYWLSLLIFEECNQFIEMRYFANRDICFQVNSPSLGSGNIVQGFDLAVIETERSPKIRETNRLRLNKMKLREGADSIVPPIKL